MNALSIINALFGGIALYELRGKNDDIISCIMLHIVINSLGIINKNGGQSIFLIVMCISSVYYMFTLLRWFKSSNKALESKKFMY